MGYLQTVNWKKELRTTLLIALLGGVGVLFMCNACLSDWDVAKVSIGYSAMMWVLLWQGNAQVSDYITYRIPWLKNPGKRFLVGIVSMIIYTVVAVYGNYYLFREVFGIKVDNVGNTILVSIVITCLISFFFNAWHFFDNWRKTAVDAERLKKEQMATKYESLKNQVNPHFLFNSLNVLTNLVYEDQDQAADFIRQLSQVYRYVLDTRTQEVVSLKTELKFVESYVYLQKIRFEEKLKVEIDTAGYEQAMVPPIAVQMLLENAIKHNTIAEEEPLLIKISIENGEYLKVKNNLQKKNIPAENSSGMGLNNIKSRYEFLTNKPVEIIETADEFCVRLPLLEISE